MVQFTLINDFIDITGLTNNTTYEFSVIATNGKGDSDLSKVVNGIPTTDNNVLTPKMWKVEPVNGGFYLGYSVDNTDTTFSIEYGTSSGNYSEVKYPGLHLVRTFHDIFNF